MSIKDRLSCTLDNSKGLFNESESCILNFKEIRLIIEGSIECLYDFATSPRIHAADVRGDTPLHLAARLGKLAVCDLFIRSGAKSHLLNHDLQTAADVALAEGHVVVAQLLSELVSQSPENTLSKVLDRDKDRTISPEEAVITLDRSSPVVYEEKQNCTEKMLGTDHTDMSWAGELSLLLKQLNSNGHSVTSINAASDSIVDSPVMQNKAQFLEMRDKALKDAEQLRCLAEETLNVWESNSYDLCDPKPVPRATNRSQLDILNEEFSFEAEEDAELFFTQRAHNSTSGTFIPVIPSSLIRPENKDSDWLLDISPALIMGEGIGSSITIDTPHNFENEFLKVRKNGRKSIKRAVIQSSTSMAIRSDFCITWAEEILTKGWCSFDDIERLIVDCHGNGDFDELFINLHRTLEVAGFDLDQSLECDAVLWNAYSDVSLHDLADAIEATLTRSTRLPGTHRFVMGRSDELQLLETMMRANQELQLAILTSELAVETILDVMDSIRGGSRDPVSVSLKTIIPSRPGHAETTEVIAAADVLRSWHTSGRVMDGKQRREALAALEELDLSLTFHKELVRTLDQIPACQAEACQLEAEILISESATEHLIREHLPYVRRFASRSVEEGEDPEEVFQVAFMGLQRSTRRFDPERGYRFLIYATYWMRQAITRWRSDEGAAIRIPVHRNEKIIKFERTLERLDIRVGGVVSDLELAEKLEWTIDEVRQFRGIPREVEYPTSLDDWDNLLPEPSEVDVFDQVETEKIVREALADLPERQVNVIRMRFGIGCETDMTLEEIGQIYGVTRERIRQIEAKGLDRLSHPSRKRRLQELLGM